MAPKAKTKREMRDKTHVYWRVWVERKRAKDVDQLCEQTGLNRQAVTEKALDFILKQHPVMQQLIMGFYSMGETPELDAHDALKLITSDLIKKNKDKLKALIDEGGAK